MENLFTFHPPKNGYFNIPIKPNVRFAVVSTKNIGDIAAMHFDGSIDCDKTKHSYDCIGDDISGNQMANILSRVSGHKLQYDSSGTTLWMLSMCGVHLGTDLLRMFAWYGPGVLHGNHEQSYRDLGDKRIDFETFAKTHFTNKPIGRSMTRMVVQYVGIAAVVAATGYGLWYYKNKKQ